MSNDKVSILYRRLQKIGITIGMIGNAPWIYLDTVNGNRIKSEDFYLADHGFTIAWYGVKKGQQIELTDITEIFKMIRKYR